MKEQIRAHLERSSQVKLSLLDSAPQIAGIIDTLVTALRAEGTIYTCGNGGSTCDAMHFVEELVARFDRSRPGIRAQHFCDSATLTCWSNDYEFAGAFERQVKTFCTPKDALLVFSTSGKSPNVVRAIEAANAIGTKTVALLGKGGGPAKGLAKQSLVVSSDSSAHIQEAHIAVVHIICEAIETSLYPGS